MREKMKIPNFLRTLTTALLTVLLAQAASAAGEFEATPGPSCLTQKTSRNQKDLPENPKLTEVFGDNLFSRTWFGEKSDIVFRKDGAWAIVHPEYVPFLPWTSHQAEEYVGVISACLDLNGKPFLVIDDKKMEKTSRAEIKNGQVLLGEPGETDTYIVIPEKTAVVAETPAASSRPRRPTYSKKLE